MLLDHNFEWCLSKYCTYFLYVGSMLHWELICAASHKSSSNKGPLDFFITLAARCLIHSLCKDVIYCNLQYLSSIFVDDQGSWMTTLLFQCPHEPSPGLIGFCIPNTHHRLLGTTSFGHQYHKQLPNSLTNLPVRAVECTMNCGPQKIVPTWFSETNSSLLHLL